MRTFGAGARRHDLAAGVHQFGQCHFSSAFLGGRCHRHVISPLSLSRPSFLMATPRFSAARRTVPQEMPFSLAASLTSFEPTGPLLSSISRNCLALSRALGDLFSDAACSASVAVISTGLGCHTMCGAWIGFPVR